MASTIGQAVPLFGPRHDGIYSPQRMHTFIRIYKCYRYLRPSRLLIFVTALVIFWRQNLACSKIEENYTNLQKVCEDGLQQTQMSLFDFVARYNNLSTKSDRFMHTLFSKLLDPNRPTIYAITPTFARPVQKAELTRLAQTFSLVPKFHWIVIEDAPKKSDLVKNLLNQSEFSFKYTHLNALTPTDYKLGKNDPNWTKPRGVEQRNLALTWIRQNLNSSHNGVVFFADDDNTYSIKLFDEMVKVKKVGVWPVGLVGGLMVEKPLCNNVTNKVTGFNSMWKPDRPFPIDMAGFAINLQLILKNPNVFFSFDVPRGYQESEILRQLVTKDDLEPLADACTKVYVWHTRTEQPKLSSEQILIKKGRRSNLRIEV